jgi:basic amino acid/polyamine antiporter, APA family
VKNPEKTVPLAMILSLLMVGVLYSLVVFVTTGVLSPDQLDLSLTPITDGAYAFMGKKGTIALGLAAILAFVSTANAGIMAASRYPLALARDRLIPDMFGRINRRFKTPDMAILFTGIFMVAAIFMDLNLLVKAASTVLILTFMFSSLCVIIMRESRVQNYQPVFRSPLYPWTQIAGIVGSWLLVINMGKQPLVIGSLLCGVGFLVYWFYGRKRGEKDFALLHLIERVTARELVNVTLEAELRDIIRERDDMNRDRFDKVVEKALVLDIEGPMGAEELFKKAAVAISDETGADEHAVFRFLLDREEQSSTVLSPGLAIPHIIIPGEKTFVMLLARSREGIIFPAKEEKVHAVFVIAGTKDERNFHLRALAAIAQIVQNRDFDARWMAAKSGEALRDLILLGKRRRH